MSFILLCRHRQAPHVTQSDPTYNVIHSLLIYFFVTHNFLLHLHFTSPKNIGTTNYYYKNPSTIKTNRLINYTKFAIKVFLTCPNLLKRTQDVRVNNININLILKHSKISYKFIAFVQTLVFDANSKFSKFIKQ